VVIAAGYRYVYGRGNGRKSVYKEVEMTYPNCMRGGR